MRPSHEIPQVRNAENVPEIYIKLVADRKKIMLPRPASSIEVNWWDTLNFQRHWELQQTIAVGKSPCLIL